VRFKRPCSQVPTHQWNGEKEASGPSERQCWWEKPQSGQGGLPTGFKPVSVRTGPKPVIKVQKWQETPILRGEETPGIALGKHTFRIKHTEKRRSYEGINTDQQWNGKRRLPRALSTRLDPALSLIIVKTVNNLSLLVRNVKNVTVLRGFRRPRTLGRRGS